VVLLELHNTLKSDKESLTAYTLVQFV